MVNLIFRRRLIATSSGKPLPDDYQRCDFIESSGSQVINTGVNPSNDLELSAVIAVTATGLSQNRNYVFGNSVQDSRIQFSYSPSTYFAWGVGSSATISDADTTKHAILCNSSQFLLDGVMVFKPSASIAGTDVPLYMFARNTGSSVTDYANGLRIYKCTIKKNGAIIRNFVPCVRIADQKAGLYDMINDQFYVSIGASDFIIGTD